MNRFQPFLNTLAQAMHLPSLAPDAQGGCLITPEEEIPLLFEFDDALVPNTVLVSTPLAPLSREAEKILYMCLEGNGEIEETLSLKPDEEYIFLHRRLYPEMSASQLEEFIPAYVTQVKKWREKLSSDRIRS